MIQPGVRTLFITDRGMNHFAHLLFFILFLAACSPEKESSWPPARARQALQISMEQDRAYLKVADDSLARVAYDYYSRFGSRRKRMLSAFYLGTVQANAGNTVEASVLLMEAERRAQQIKDYHYRGFAQQRLAELYAQNQDHEEAQAYNLKALESFTLSQDTLSADICRIYVARHYILQDRLNQADALLNTLRPSGNKPNALIQAYAAALKGNICFKREQWEEAARYYGSIGDLGYRPTLQTLGNSAYIQEIMGFPNRADSLMEVARGQIASAIDSTIYYSCAQDLYVLRNDYPNAYKALETTASAQNKSVSYLLARSVTHAQKAYFEEHYHLEQARRRNLALGTMLAILLFVSAIILLVQALQQRKIEIERERERIEDLKKDLRLLQEEQRAAGIVVDTLLQDRINKIQQLSGSYFYWTDEALSLRQTQNVSALTREVIAEFRDELRSLRDDPHFFANIEKALDLSHGRLMQRLRRTVSRTPGLQFDEKDYQLLALLFASFSPKSIGFILDMKDDAVRKRKSRYKKLFADRGAAFLEFLEHLS